MSEDKRRLMAGRRKRRLIFRFGVNALIVTSLVVLAMMIVSYYQIRAKGLTASLDSISTAINIQLSQEFSTQESTNISSINWLKIADYSGVKYRAFYDSKKKLLWASGQQVPLTEKEQKEFQNLLKGDKPSYVSDNYVPKLAGLREFFGNSNTSISGLIALRDDNGNILGVLKLVKSYAETLDGAEQAVRSLFWYISGGSLLLFFTLFYNFRDGLITIQEQEQELNQQILKLSELLAINQGMQKSMKTASSRAVELNEQFLRRVGSDLHDGPAQSIGYAILRLDRISKEEHAKKLSQDFHVVKEALDGALDEIRGISSGLVLPELEDMTLAQSLRKVVIRHSSNSDTNITQYYQDLPEQIPLPVKICAYRFVQEGLNNAHRHGQAKKCRVTAYVKDDVLHLSLKDNGMGFRKSQLSSEGGHLGLMGLKDRIESLGGKFSINSELGVGTAIKASITISEDV